MRLITRTLIGGELQTATILGLPYQPRPNTTLNQLLNIQANSTFNAGQYPKARYWAIGDGGHQVVAGADGSPYISPIKHRVSDFSCFKHLPFVLRLETNDLSPEQRVKYGLRRAETHNGRRYFAYYLKRLDFTNVATQLYQTVVRDGVETTVPFTPNNSNLNPQPPVLPPNQSVPTLSQGDYLSTSAIIPVDFTAWDITEFVEVAKIIYDNELRAVISEIALVSGVDRQVSAEGPGGTPFQFNEVIGAQVLQHVTTYTPLAFTNQGVQFVFEAGVTEALLTEVTNPPATP